MSDSGKPAAAPASPMWDDMKDRANSLIESLEKGDLQAASGFIHAINEARDHSIYCEVGKLTRGLHEAIVNFEIPLPGTADDEAISKMANAQERLDYVITLTESAADKTMDAVEEGIPMVTDLGGAARELRADWQRLIRRELNPDEFRELYHRIDQFLEHTSLNADTLGEKFNAILLAQDFQDLSGQVIKKVITLVQEVEDRLVDLMRLAAEVEELTGIVGDKNKAQASEEAAEPAASDNAIKGEGPQVKAEQRDDVVSGQDEVDDLLSSLGF